MSGLDQWSRMLAWQTRALMEREGYDLGPLPKAPLPKPSRRFGLLRGPLGRRAGR
ncbi:MAG: hypothetical protein WC211_05875 [Dehalococcoidia bacterium]